MNEIPELPPDCLLDRIYQYCRSKCKAPDPIVFWTVMAFAGASIKNLMYFDMPYKRIYPNLPLLIIGRSGIGKTSAVATVQKIFGGMLPDILSEDATAESFVQELSSKFQDDSSIGMWIIPELADVIGKKDYKSGSIAKITRLLDNPKDLTISRIKYDEPIKIQGFCVLHFLACSTLEWLISHVEASASSGGFLPRLTTIFCNDKGKYVDNPHSDEAIEYGLGSDILNLFYKMKKAPMRIIPELELVRREYHDETQECDNERVLPYKERKYENFLRLFMITHAFLRNAENECVITHQIRIAKTLANIIENNGLRLNRNLLTHSILNIFLLKSVVGCVTRHLGRSIKYSSIMNSLRVESHELKPILEVLQGHGLVEWNGRFGENGLVKADKIIDCEALLAKLVGEQEPIQEVAG